MSKKRQVVLTFFLLSGAYSYSQDQAVVASANDGILDDKEQTCIMQQECESEEIFSQLVESQVAAQKKAIESDFQKNRYLRYGIYSACGALATYTAWKFVDWWRGSDLTPDLKTLAAEQQRNRAAIAGIDANAFNQEELSAGKRLLENMKQTDWWSTKTMNFLYIMLQTMGAHALVNRLDGIFHDGNLHWYMNTHTKLPYIAGELDELKKRLQDFMLRRSVVKGYEVEHYRQTLIDLFKQLKNDVAKLIGFIEFKIENDTELSQMNITNGRYLFNVVNALMKKLNNGFAQHDAQSNEKLQLKELVRLIDLGRDFGDDLHVVAVGFNRLEEQAAS